MKSTNSPKNLYDSGNQGFEGILKVSKIDKCPTTPKYQRNQKLKIEKASEESKNHEASWISKNINNPRYRVLQLVYINTKAVSMEIRSIVYSFRLQNLFFLY